MHALPAFRTTFETVLRGLVSTRIEPFAAMAGDPVLASVIRQGGELMLAGGKRIRPYLASLGYRCFQDEVPDAALRAMASLEFFHLFALIQDDIIDQGTSRHGFPTAHLAVADHMQREQRIGDVARIGQSQAMLLGDLFLNWSYRLLEGEREAIDAVNVVEARRWFSRMADEVILGQMIDVDLTARDVVPSELIERKMQLKTASYTFTRPLQIGAALAGARSADVEAFVPFADALGLAFQMQDDLFDLTLTSEQSGKTAFSDLRERQHTVFTQYIAEHGTTIQQQELASMFGAELTEDDRPRILRLFTDSQAMAAGLAKIEYSFRLAEDRLQDLPFVPAVKTEFAQMLDDVRRRER